MLGGQSLSVHSPDKPRGIVKIQRESHAVEIRARKPQVGDSFSPVQPQCVQNLRQGQPLKESVAHPDPAWPTLNALQCVLSFPRGQGLQIGVAETPEHLAIPGDA